MIKRTPNRNNRSRGFRVKHVLQICLLLGVCFWLIYQVKHSHDKKKELDEKEAKISVRTETDDGLINLGRKGLLPRVQEMGKNEKHGEDDEEETVIEDVVDKLEESKLEQQEMEEAKREEPELQEDETRHKEVEEDEERERTEHKRGEEGEEQEEGTKNAEDDQEEGNKHEEEGRQEETKHEEVESEEENKHEDEEQGDEAKTDETEDEGRGVGDDEIDERDQEKIEGEADHGEDFVDEEKDREEEGDGKDNRYAEGEDKTDQAEDESLTEDQDRDAGVENDREAREVNYRADDASSAVTHDTQVVSTDTEKSNSENSSENSLTNNLELEKNSTDSNRNDIDWVQQNSTLQLKYGESDPSSDVTDDENKSKGDMIVNSEHQLSRNETFDSITNNQNEANKSTGVNTEAGSKLVDEIDGTSGTSQKNETVASDSNQPQNVTDGGNRESSNVKTTELEQVNVNITSGSKELDSNSGIVVLTENNGTVAGDLKFSSNLELGNLDKSINPEVKAEDVNTGSNSTMTKTVVEASQDENWGTKSESNGTNENTDETEAVHDPIDSSDSSVGQDEKEARIDLGTLPENITETVNSRDAAAE